MKNQDDVLLQEAYEQVTEGFFKKMGARWEGLKKGADILKAKAKGIVSGEGSWQARQGLTGKSGYDYGKERSILQSHAKEIIDDLIDLGLLDIKPNQRSDAMFHITNNLEELIHKGPLHTFTKLANQEVIDWQREHEQQQQQSATPTVTKKPTTKKPTAKKPTAKKPTAKKPTTTTKPTTTKPTNKKPIAKKS